MAQFINGPVTANLSKQIHAGLNTHIASYTLDETASGSTTIALLPLPAGAQITKVTARANHGALNAGAAAGAVRLYATIGGNSIGNVINTSTLSYQIESGASGNNESGLGVRLTGSGNLMLAIHDVNGTGTASTVFTVICQYLSEEEGD